ncbi:unnamed protein product, partial [Haemonchus placei]|uniref:RDD family protein n=1 Tax=Haemonchus placei TaxID=6290 RepID=A0A0N4X8D1_HAEPC
ESDRIVGDAVTTARKSSFVVVASAIELPFVVVPFFCTCVINKDGFRGTDGFSEKKSIFKDFLKRIVPLA